VKADKAQMLHEMLSKDVVETADKTQMLQEILSKGVVKRAGVFEEG
jgi:hypothetical protein